LQRANETALRPLRRHVRAHARNRHLSEHRVHDDQCARALPTHDRQHRRRHIPRAENNCGDDTFEDVAGHSFHIAIGHHRCGVHHDIDPSVFGDNTPYG
jgi:hypothetical protein